MKLRLAKITPELLMGFPILSAQAQARFHNRTRMSKEQHAACVESRVNPAEHQVRSDELDDAAWTPGGVGITSNLPQELLAPAQVFPALGNGSKCGKRRAQAIRPDAIVGPA